MRCFEFTTRVQPCCLLLAVIFTINACGNGNSAQGDAESTPTQSSDPQSATSPFDLYSLESDLSGLTYESVQNADTAAQFPVPQLTVSASPGLLDFQWSTTEKPYLVSVIQTNLSKREFKILFETQDSLTTNWSFEVNTPSFNWSQNRFMLEVCDAEQCLYSNSVASNDYQRAVAGKLVIPDGTTKDLTGAALAVTADSTTLVVGAPAGAQTELSNTGTLRVHFRVGQQWWPDTRLQAVGMNSGALLGQSVDISDDGDTIVAGAPSGATGAAVVFERFGEGWSQTTKLTPTSETFSAFGSAVKISADGNTIVVSAPEAALEAQASSGVVWVYKRGTGGWQLSQKITLAAANTTTRFGSAIALSSDSNTLFVSDKKGIGQVHVYTLSSDQYNWSHTIGDEQLGNAEGFANIITTNATGTVLIASLRNSPPGSMAARQAAVFSLQEDLGWKIVQKLTPSGEQFESSRITLANSADAGVISVGLMTPGKATNTVTTFVDSSPKFTTQNWRYATTLANPESEPNGFATSLGMSADGHTLLIGAPQLSENGLSEVGGVFYY